MYLKKHIYWIVYLFLLASCEYEFNKENILEVDPTSPYKNLPIDLMSQPDTIILLNSTLFKTTIQLNEGQKIYKYEVYLNDALLNTSNYATGSFEVSPDNIHTGPNRLLVKIYTNSGTNSLIDRAEMEVVSFSKSWTLIGDKSKPVALDITKIYDFDGQLKVEWQKNNNINFKSYKVYRDVYYYSNYEHENKKMTALVKTITNPDSTWFVDETYIGGLVNYRIDNYSLYDYTVGNTKSYNGPYPTFYPTRKITEDSLFISWKKCRYYKNFRMYHFYFGYYDATKMTTDINDTTFTYKFKFGNSTGLNLITYSNLKIPPYNDSEDIWTEANAYVGDIIPSHLFMVHSNLPDIVYLVQSQKISRYSLSQNKILNTLPTTYSIRDEYDRNVGISPDGKVLVYFDGRNLNVLDPAALSVTKTMDIEKLVTGSILRSIDVANNGAVAVSMRDINYYTNFTAGVFNVLTADTIQKFYPKEYRLSISANGKYLLVDDVWGGTSLYRNSNPLTLLYDLDQNAYYKFNPLNEEQIYESTSNAIQLINCSNRSVLDQYTLNTLIYIEDIDALTGKLMTNLYGGAIIDFNAKRITNTVKCVPYGQFSYFNNTLFSSQGFKMVLNN